MGMKRVATLDAEGFGQGLWIQTLQTFQENTREMVPKRSKIFFKRKLKLFLKKQIKLLSHLTFGLYDFWTASFFGFHYSFKTRLRLLEAPNQATFLALQAPSLNHETPHPSHLLFLGPSPRRTSNIQKKHPKKPVKRQSYKHPFPQKHLKDESHELNRLLC